jgi:hypothetical protein
LAHHLALESCDALLIFSGDADLGFLVVQFASIEMGQTKLDEVC